MSRSKLFFASVLGALKDTSCFKSGPRKLRNNHFVTSSKGRLNLNRRVHSVDFIMEICNLR